MADLLSSIRLPILTRLEKELDPRLGYHNLSHTLDVFEQAQRIAKEEGVTDDHDLLLLKIATLYHDSGFLFTYKGHEEKSCEILLQDLSGKLPEEELAKICGMIRATRIPQSPHTLLEEIICDADLDYLGRDDFEPISKHLHKEFIEFNIIPRDAVWDHVQIGFFESHHYFTKSSIKDRKEKKEEYLIMLKERSNWKK